MTDPLLLGLEVTPHDRWLELDLGLGEADLARVLSRRFAATTHPALLEFLADRLATIAAHHRASGTTQRLWVLLGAGEQLAPVAVATLRAVPSATHDPLVVLVEATGDPDLAWPRTLDTASGPATTVRSRRVPAPQEQDHPLAVVCWVRPDAGRAVVLAAYGIDAAAGAVVPALLEELAAGVGGL